MRKMRALVMLGAAVLVSACKTMPDAAAVNRMFADPNFQQGSQRLIDAHRPLRPALTCNTVGLMTTCY